jgi:hypothetical protein
MDDYQVILYIIFGIIYFIFNLLKNKAKPPAAQDEAESTEGGPQTSTRGRETGTDPFDETVGRPRSRRGSFEELLEEFEEAATGAGKRAGEKVKKVEEQRKEYEPTDEAPDTTFMEREAERRMRETEARKALQEKASAEDRAVAIDHELSRKLEETARETEEIHLPIRGRRESTQHERRKKVLQMLQDPESLKSTVVAAEILKRKHF